MKVPASKASELTQEHASESMAIEVPQISMPKGGGALRPVDDRFQVNPSDGSASVGIPLPLTAGRQGLTPGLSLSYSSGGGNGPFGLGWSIGHQQIARRTDKRIPRYDEEDVFTLSGAEDLVPWLDEAGGAWTPRAHEADGLRVAQYRPRVEGSFARIERIENGEGECWWKVTSKDNVVTLFGRSADARIADPADERRVFAWLPELKYDDQGNWLRFRYKAEDAAGVAHECHERNRLNRHAAFTNRYPKRVQYGNHTPWYADHAYDPTPPAHDAAFFFELVLDYGEHDAQVPTPEDAAGWPAREDPFSTGRSGFEIRTWRLCRRILMFHRFQELGPDPCLVRSLDLAYEAATESDRGLAEVNRLIQATPKGYIRREDGTYSAMAMPPMTFTYQALEWNTEVREVSAESTANAPVGLSKGYRWVDLYGEGTPGILTEQANAWYYKSNLGHEDGELRLAAAEEVIPRPSLLGFAEGVLTLQDLDANGQKQVVVRQPGLQGYFEVSDKGEPGPFHPFDTIPQLASTDPGVRQIDLDGDGRIDLVVTEEDVFVWYPSRGKAGYGRGERRVKPLDEEEGPAIVFSNDEESIFLADMTGDGLTDLVRIRNGEVCYWANLGYGTFGARVTMLDSPILDDPDAFDPRLVQLADISGTGPTDLVYSDGAEVKAYINLSGNGWSEARTIDPAFPIHEHAQLQVIDLLSTGTACLVWSSLAPADRERPMRFIDLMNGRKPHLLVHYANNLGRETYFEYQSSASYYLNDKRDGRPWITKLPFPVQVVSRMIAEEKITQVRFSTEFQYHHGYYDFAEREFRGFGMVEQLDTEHYDTWRTDHAETKLELSQELYQAPVLTRTWFHTGAFLDRSRILDQYQGEYWSDEYNRAFPDAPLAVSEPKLDEARLVPAVSIVDPTVIDELSAAEWCEALRACKGMVLRQEVFAQDGQDQPPESDDFRRQYKPYSVATNNCLVQLLQPRGGNPHAVFTRIESEALTLNYERDERDPRVAHTLNVRVDELGNVLESASIVYGRSQADASLPTEIQKKQATTHITCGRRIFTNDVIEPEAYRLRSVAEQQSFEITGLSPSGDLYRLGDFDDILGAASAEIAYHEGSDATQTQRRLIERVKHLYYADDLSGPLAPGVMESRGIAYESYQLAYTEALLGALFGDKLPATPADREDLLGDNDTGSVSSQCKLVHLGDDNWWIRSGTLQYIDTDAGEGESDALSRFFVPVSYTDPFGSISRARYYSDYSLVLESIEDAIGNAIAVEEFNFRVMQPARVRDLNDNLSAALFDELGLTKAVAAMGKGAEADALSGLSEVTSEAERALIRAYFDEADSTALRATARQLLGPATSRFVHDLGRYADSKAALEAQLLADPETMECAQVKLQPVVAGTISREEHQAVNPESALQLQFEYSDGAGKLAMVKIQAEPGEAQRLEIAADCTYSVETVDTRADGRLRWIGNGRTVLNNKGNPVKQYEPYFSVNPFYEDARELVEQGVTPILHYDAPGRAIRTDRPDGTFLEVAFDAWKQVQFGANDTVVESAWFAERGSPDPAGPAPTDKDALAAWKAAQHADTPTLTHLDSLGRGVYHLVHNRRDGVDELYATVINLDVEGNVRSVVDARNNEVVSHGHDMLGHRVYGKSMDAGERWNLGNVAGNPVRRWDSRGHVVSWTYDALQRPVQVHVAGGDGDLPLDHVHERFVYGEGQTDDVVRNLRGELYAHYDFAGKSMRLELDLAGNLLEGNRRFATNYKDVPDWSGADPDALLETETFSTRNAYDALNRIIETTYPDGSIVSPTYNEAGLLDGLTLESDTGAGGAREDRVFVRNIDYDEKRRRERITYGNEVTTTYHYDPLSQRLLQLTTRRQDGTLLQEQAYTYDAAGNITEIADGAMPTVFFGNQMVEPRSAFTYDALNRLIEALGREHIGQVDHGSSDSWQDQPFRKTYDPNDPMAWRTYAQTYRYDEVGNLEEIDHQAGDGSWKRTYSYPVSSNRLEQTAVGAQTYAYPHHPAHGFITEMPHLQVMEWNFRNELRAVAKQRVLDGTPETTYYVYDANGHRVRKVTENEAAGTAVPTRKDERFYLGGVEIYRRHTGRSAGLERRTIHLLDDTRRIAMVDLRNDVDDGTDRGTIRYQIADHLGSCSLETDEAAQVISYEVFHPYGTTAYQAVSAEVSAAAKRYRYTGRERDEESGFSYHQARYYLPWLGRWLSADPAGLRGGINLYAYANGNPVAYNDPGGRDARLTVDQDNATITYSTTIHFFGTAAQIAQVRPLAQQAEQFFANPPIETEASTQGRLRGNQTIPPGARTFTDANGKVWTVNYDVTYQFHDIATVQPAFTYASIDADPQTYAQNYANLVAQLTADVGFQPGDNVMTLAPGVGNTGGVTAYVSTPDPAFPTFGLPHSNTAAQIADLPGYMLESLIHETGHMLGFDERYDSSTGLVQNHQGFQFDLMSSGQGRSLSAIAMEPEHIRASAEFALGVAGGMDLTNQALIGFSVDTTGRGAIQQFDNAGATRQAYTNAQGAVATELVPHFQAAVTRTVPPSVAQAMQRAWQQLLHPPIQLPPPVPLWQQMLQNPSMVPPPAQQPQLPQLNPLVFPF